MSKTLDKKKLAIFGALEEVKKQLDVAHQNFELATDDALIDGYIYEIYSLNSKYQYFLQKAKGSGLIAEGFDKLDKII